VIGPRTMINRGEFAEKIRSGQPVIGIWMQIPHPTVAETLAQTGVDFLLIDGEHAPIPPDVLGTLLPCTELHNMPVLYRVRWNRTELIKAALDHGVSGLMVPMVNSAGEAADAVASAKYPPVGKRGIGAWRASNYYLNEVNYIATANSTTPVVVQIETKEALQSLDEIAATPGLDALYVGPGDLALSLGVEPGELHPDLLAACARVAEAARKNGIAAGIDVASLDFAKTYRDLGFSLLTHGVDFGLILDGGREIERQLCAR
jgi:2-keto-3-deoxy-L-rhamnonate aldolase RhmA